VGMHKSLLQKIFCAKFRVLTQMYNTKDLQCQSPLNRLVVFIMSTCTTRCFGIKDYLHPFMSIPLANIIQHAYYRNYVR
jgi:hypothetical protein